MKRTLKLAFGAIAVGGVLVVGGQAALAHDGIKNTRTAARGRDLAPVAQVAICGNSVAVADARASGRCGGSQRVDRKASESSDARRRPSQGDELAGAGDISPHLQAGVCGNSAAVLGGRSGARCDGDNQSPSRRSAPAEEGGSRGTALVAIGDVSPGAQAAVCGNSIALAGSDTSSACTGTNGHRGAPTSADAGDDQTTSPSVVRALLSASTITPVAQATVCANAIAGWGTASATCGAQQSASLDTPPRTESDGSGISEEDSEGIAGDPPRDPIGAAPRVLAERFGPGGTRVLGKHFGPGGSRVLGKRFAAGDPNLLGAVARAGDALPYTGTSLGVFAAWAALLLGGGAGLVLSDYLERRS